VADTKLSDLTSATPAAGDLIYICDVSDTTDDPAGSSKKATVAGILSLAAAAAAAGYQPLDSDLTAIAALTTTTFGRSLLALADAAALRTALAFAAPKDVSVSFTDNGDAYFVAPEAMTLAASPSVGGTGTLAYTKALAADTTSFSSTSLPVTLAAGDVLKITVSGISTYKGVTLRRSA
jgi:hypothetical protein